MAKPKRYFECNNCGYQCPKWLGQCPSCKAWESLVEQVTTPQSAAIGQQSPATVTSYRDVAAEAFQRIPSGMDELDRVLGGGIVPGSLLLIGGDPGIGKSTLMLQMAAFLHRAGPRVLYLSGEESLAQIKLRGGRLGLTSPELALMSETSLESLLATLDQASFDLLVIDSIQTMYTGAVPSAPGSLTQVREVTSRLMTYCKPRNITVFLVGHITKDGAIAGPKTLEHMVDGVFYFEGDRYHSLRLLRAQKNRFGPANELGIFQMDHQGLQEVPNPSKVLLEQRPDTAPGSVVVPCIEGTRPLMVEVQVLTSGSTYASPRRLSMGLDSNRVALLIAVLEKKAGLQLQGLDVFVNLVGGISVQEPAIDLPLALAIYSSFRAMAFQQDIAVFGELGLAGEVRAVSQTALRFKECRNMGFKTVICPPAPGVDVPPGLTVREVSNVVDALEASFN